jgi:hypothetical protein
MQKRIPTIIALTALVVAMFGSTPLGNAAGSLILAKNSVGTSQVKNNAVTTAKVKNGTFTAADFRGGVLPAGPKGDTGAAGAAGLQGPKGDKGDTGATGQPGLSGHQVIVGAGMTRAPGATTSAAAFCPAGKKAIAGGFNTLVSGLRSGARDLCGRELRAGTIGRWRPSAPLRSSASRTSGSRRSSTA